MTAPLLRVVFKGGRKFVQFTALDKHPELRKKPRKNAKKPAEDDFLTTTFLVPGHPGPAPEDHKEWRAWYFKKYLVSEARMAKRNAVMSRAQGACESCQGRRATQVHHLSYKCVGDEPLDHLLAVCGFCHARIHSVPVRRAAA